MKLYFGDKDEAGTPIATEVSVKLPTRDVRKALRKVDEDEARATGRLQTQYPNVLALAKVDEEERGSHITGELTEQLGEYNVKHSELTEVATLRRAQAIINLDSLEGERRAMVESDPETSAFWASQVPEEIAASVRSFRDATKA
jgi:hypothetical protein